MLDNKVDMDIWAIISASPLFERLPESIRDQFLNSLEEVRVGGGECLIKEGEEANCLYIVLQGRLKVYKEKNSDREVCLGEIGVGQVVGEMGVIADSKRVATVYAIRDSIVLKLSKEKFLSLSILHPSILLNFSRVCITRLVSSVNTRKHSPLKTIALLPAGDLGISQEFIRRFIKKLNQKAKVLHVTSGSLYKEASDLLLQEERYTYVVYEADQNLTEWTKLCIRQADRIVFIGDKEHLVHLNEVERYFAQDKRHVESELVILHPKENEDDKGVACYLQQRTMDRYHHIYGFCDQDLQRFIRLMCGEAIGLVLSGGGARGFAHIGLIRALQEKNIPIDYVGGTSMGAAIAAGVAMGMNHHKLAQVAKDFMVPATKKWDFTLPILSLRSGKGVTEACQEIIGINRYIEDCRTNFFCVATNLSKHRLEIIERGLLWKAVRSSLSLPVIFPPIVDLGGDLIIDGGIINNFPVDIMKTRINGGRILAASVTPSCHPKYDESSAVVSGWDLYMEGLLHHKDSYPRIGNIIMSSLMLGSEHHQIEMEHQADFCVKYDMKDIDLLDFHRCQEIIDRGYETALRQLEGSPFYKEC